MVCSVCVKGKVLTFKEGGYSLVKCLAVCACIINIHTLAEFKTSITFIVTTH